MHQYTNDFKDKLAKIRTILEKDNLNGILITKQCNYSWLTHARAFIGMATEMASVNLLVTKEAAYLITNNIEKKRMLSEEIKEIREEIDVLEYPWYEENVKNILIETVTSGNNWKYDLDYEEDFVVFRSNLSELDIELLKYTSFHTARAVEDTCRELHLGMTEYETAGLVSKKLWEQGIEPVTVLIAFDGRIGDYRHPLPSDNKLEKYAMVAVNARQRGLFASVTRFISFSELSTELKNKFHALARIDATFIHNTRPGVLTGDIIKKVIGIYDELGYKDEWKLHHQGGLTGYLSREYRCTAQSENVIRENHAYAWNPTITGSKAEDTIIVGKDRNEILSYTGEYIYQIVNLDGQEYQIPAVLIKSD